MKWRLIVAEFYKYNSNFTKIIYAKLKKIKPTLYIYITIRVLSSTNILPDKNTTKIQKSSQD